MAGSEDLTRTPGEGQFSFHVEWYDSLAELLRPFHVKYFEVDDTLEIFDPKGKRMFLKRCRPVEKPVLGDFYVGAVNTLYSRKMKVVAYADSFTADYFAARRACTLGLVRGDALGKVGKVLAAVRDGGVAVGRIRMLKLSRSQADEFVRLGDAEHDKADVGPRRGLKGAALAAAISEGPVCALELVGETIVARWESLCGPVDGSRAGTLRAEFGDCFYASPSRAGAAVDVDYVFERPHPATARYAGCSLVMLKPHCVADGSYADVIDAMQNAGFEITAMRSIGLDASAADDYLEVYKGVVPEFRRWVAHFASGKSVALEVCGDGVVDRLREFLGPYDPEIAKILRPETLRAKMGKNSVLNCCHATDIEADGPLESKFIFHLLTDYQ